jgi:hypothetical protein
VLRPCYASQQGIRSITAKHFEASALCVLYKNCARVHVFFQSTVVAAEANDLHCNPDLVLQLVLLQLPLHASDD